MAFLEINLKSLDENISIILNHIPNDCRIIAVLKANAYGLGAVEIAKHLNSNKKIAYFAVARIEEAIELREANIDKPIFVFSNLNLFEIKDYVRYKIEASITDSQVLESYFSYENLPLSIHINVNTGMNRLGINADELLNLLDLHSRKVKKSVKSIYSHFANADIKSHPLNQFQIDRFQYIYDKIKPNFPEIKFHLQNSGAIINEFNQFYDFVRTGIILSGNTPNPDLQNIPGIKLIYKLKAKVIQVLNINPGDSVGYGSSYISKTETNIASIGIGYGDGYSRALSNQAIALFGNHEIPLIGNISMDQSSIEIGKNITIQKNDELTLYSDENQNTHPAFITKRLGTIPYELLTSLNARVKRVYIT